MKTAFLFSGQGAQYPGMLKDLYESEQAAKRIFDIADQALGRSVSSLCFEGTQEELNLTHNTQPCVLAADLAAGMALRAYGIEPDAVAGFSLGEYAALSFAGSMTEEEVFRLIQIRADAMQDAVKPGEGAMAAFIGVTPEQAEAICEQAEDYVVPANYNSLVQTVVSGTAAGVDKACEIAAAQGIHCMKLAVSAPFHCKLMEPAAMKLKEVFSGTTFREPAIPVYMNVDGMLLKNAGCIPELLVRQAMSPVRWVQTLQEMQKNGISTFIECGPGRTLSGLVKKTLDNVVILRVEDCKTLKSTLEALNI